VRQQLSVQAVQLGLLPVAQRRQHRLLVGDVLRDGGVDQADGLRHQLHLGRATIGGVGHAADEALALQAIEAAGQRARRDEQGRGEGRRRQPVRRAGAPEREQHVALGDVEARAARQGRDLSLDPPADLHDAGRARHRLQVEVRPYSGPLADHLVDLIRAVRHGG
jgi:hypothetical protein